MIPFDFETKQVSVTFDFIDWYGADVADIGGNSWPKNKVESLKALFMQQHCPGVGHPFQTTIRVTPLFEYTIK